MDQKNPKRLAVHFILAGIVLLGCFLRIYQLGKNPPSLYWDEASLGYNAYAIANFGMDEHGERYPLARFTTFGDYKPPGYIYLAALSIKLFQLSEWSIRLPSALAGIVMVIVTYYLVVELLESRLVALVSSFFVAVSPWSLQLSRAAFEANVAACFNLIAIFFFLRAVKGKGLHLVVSVVFFMLAFYTFNANRIISPLLFLVLVVIWFSRRSSFLRTVVVSGIVAIVLLIPSIPFLVSKEGRLRFQEVSIFTNLDIVKVANSRVSRDAGNWLGQMLNNRRVLFVQELARHFLDHFDMRYLFLSGDRNPRLSIQSIGQFYFFEFFFLITGVIYIIKYGKKKALTILAWLIIALLPAATARETPHALSSASAIPVGQILSAMGLVFWIRHFRLHSWNRLFLMLTLVAFEFQTFFYFHNYYVHAPARWAGEWQYGYKQMVEYMKSHDQDYKSVIVTRRLGRPYIYFLLYEGISPQDYLSQRRAERDWWGLWEVYGFGKYYFDVGYLPKVEKPALFVGIPGEIPSEARILKTVISPSGELIFIIGEL